MTVFDAPQRRSEKSSPARSGAGVSRSGLLERPSRKAEVSSADLPRLPWSFARIPIYPPAPRAIQTKLAVNRPGDEYEQEADRVAALVMRMPDAALQVKAQTAAGIQRACSCGGTCDKCKKEEASGQLQRLPADSGQPIPAEAPPIVHDVLSSPGRPLDPAARAFFEPRFGYDFGSIRVHAGGEAADSARALGARAYTVGRHIVFGSGESAAARPLLAHELTHVVQQNNPGFVPAVQRAITLTDPGGTPPHPAGMPGPFLTKAATLQGWLHTLCPDGNWTVNPGSGAVESADRTTFCGTLPTKGHTHRSTTAQPASCGCLCVLTGVGSRPIEVQIDENLTVGAHTIPLTAQGEGATGFRGALGNVSALTGREFTGITGAGATAPTAGTGRNETLPDPPWLIFGHEVCGHAKLQTASTAVQHTTTPGGTSSAVDIENRIRREHSTTASSLGIRHGEIKVQNAAGNTVQLSGAAFQAAASDTIPGIAVRCGIPVAQLLDHIWRSDGSRITAATQNTLAAGEQLLIEGIDWHQVITGETMPSIAATWSIPLASLQRANPGIPPPYTVHPGDRLLIPAS